VVALGEGGSIRSDGAWECFCWRVSRDSLLGLTKELSPDIICKAPLILKLDRFWFTRLFIFVAGSLRALFGCGVACLGETSGFWRLSDSRYVLIFFDFMQLVREIPLCPGPDDRTERGKHSRRCQSSSAFEDMALLMNLLSPEAKEGRAPLGIRWMGCYRISGIVEHQRSGNQVGGRSRLRILKNVLG